ncbi:MAG: hypothetical protein Ctma_1589 [Catillopecten margaritatus gill symbiont]|uniref:Toluene tolerance protein n=1 Tax=Catillopecten margaritatus gill symbiont TaxID=3083288 RepID=A0AAU6PIE5_9GAMM
MKNTIQTLLIILSILSINVTLAVENDAALDAEELHSIINPPSTAALNIMVGALSSLKELRKQGHASPENVRKLINIKLLPNISMVDSTRLALIGHWNSLNDEQRQLFQRYITHALIKDYAGALGSYKDFDSVNISVGEHVKRKDNRAIVKLEITLGNDPIPFKITLNMVRSDHWRIYDVKFSGVSMIKTYRAQFNSHVKRKGLDSLIEKIEKKLTKG